ncbi:hypothetical protein BGZ60DRAFT_424462 [Tricladium varicosporioides]|nr:hypothetical protein BGZ60DRAFT_424462 [Hymenoscyphus varicosporioides]
MPKIITLSIWALAVQSSIAGVVPRADSVFGSCSDPTIIVVKDLDGLKGSGFKSHNTNDFPHGAAQDITAITDLICSRLKNFCNAPAATNALCSTAASAVKGKTGQSAADTFNNAITKSAKAPATSTANAPATKSSAASTALATPKINIKVSSNTVSFDDPVMDPKWWFDNHMIASGDPAICDEKSIKMPNSKYITFTCTGADSRTVPYMKNAINKMIDATIDNTTAKAEERMFMHTEVTYYEGKVLTGGIPKTKKVTIWPSEMHIEMAVDIPGVGGALSGNMRYSITENLPGSCKTCSYLSAFGGSTGAGVKVGEIVSGWAKLASPATAFASTLVTFGCLAGC